jgi:hypothetical protein
MIPSAEAEVDLAFLASYGVSAATSDAAGVSTTGKGLSAQLAPPAATTFETEHHTT